MGATVITCIALAMVLGVSHVVKLGANRMEDMRSKATYDLKDMHKHIRAAGEDIIRHQEHEAKKKAERTYLAMTEVEALLTPEQWQTISQQVLIPAGDFFMGTDNPKSDDYNRPKHKRNLPAYYIDTHPVTNAEYAKFVVVTKHRPPLDWDNGKIPEDKAMHPVTMVTWYDARDYCEYEGKRVPTEAEWEKAARGTEGLRWPWGNKMDPQRLNTYYNLGATNVVTRFDNGVSAFGVYDMAGNVSEWTASEFEPYAGSIAAASVFKPKKLVAGSQADKNMKVADLVTAESGIFKVRRGGSWKSDPFSTSSYHRNFSLPHYASDFFGFRCAKDA